MFLNRFIVMLSLTTMYSSRVDGKSLWEKPPAIVEYGKFAEVLRYEKIYDSEIDFVVLSKDHAAYRRNGKWIRTGLFDLDPLHRLLARLKKQVNRRVHFFHKRPSCLPRKTQGYLQGTNKCEGNLCSIDTLVPDLLSIDKILSCLTIEKFQLGYNQTIGLYAFPEVTFEKLHLEMTPILQKYNKTLGISRW